jgi:hypothetical protein
VRSSARGTGLGLLALALAGTAAAQEDDAGQTRASADEAAARGALLPWSVRPSSDGPRGLVIAGGGYDSARGAAVGSAAAEVRVWGPLALRVGGFYSEAARGVRPDAGLKLGLLSQEAHGLDGAVALSYRAEGFNLKPAIEALAAVGRRFERGLVMANVAYGQGLEEGERYGDARLSALRRIAGGLHGGFDSRARLDLEREWPEPTAEPELELQAGPVLSYGLGRVAVTVHGGFSLVRFREGEKSLVGAVGGVGVGSAF